MMQYRAVGRSKNTEWGGSVNVVGIIGHLICKNLGVPWQPRFPGSNRPVIDAHNTTDKVT